MILSRYLKKALILSLSLTALVGCAQQTPMMYMPQAQLQPMQQMQARQMGANPMMFQRFNVPQQAPMLGFSSAQAPDGYYQGAEGQQGQGLLQSLNQIVARHVDLGYDQGRDVMFGVVDDLQDNNVVVCAYTDRREQNVSNRGDAYNHGLNTEHTWPKSKGAESGPPKSDLHHLFPTDIDTNSKRSSFPFGEVVQVEFQNGGSKLGRNAQGQTVFEPRDDHKGDVARALFYFYTVYGGQASTSNFRIEEPVLHQWHAQDPVDQAEQIRNARIFQYQKNRNPYIDRPEFVRLIGRFH